MNRLSQPGKQGFSLLEMVIALFIVSILFGMAIMAARSFFADEELRGSARQMALLAKTARQEAMRENRLYEIIILSDRWILQPGEEVGANNTSSKPESQKPGEEVEPIEYLVPSSIQMKIRLWGSNEWEKPRELVWSFPATGLCAPNSVRLERGKSWMQMTFNPLTANRQDEEWYLP